MKKRTQKKRKEKKNKSRHGKYETEQTQKLHLWPGLNLPVLARPATANGHGLYSEMQTPKKLSNQASCLT